MIIFYPDAKRLKNILSLPGFKLSNPAIMNWSRRVLVSVPMGLSLLMSSTFLHGCNNSGPSKSQQEIVKSQSEQLNDWFEARFDESIARSPMSATYMGLAQNQDRLDDTSELAQAETAALTESWLAEMRRRFDRDRLDDTSELSYRLYEYVSADEIASYEYRDHFYIFQHMNGPHTGFPAFMANMHAVNSIEDAENYISRLEQSSTYLNHYIARADSQAMDGILLPKFVYPKISESAQNVISGQPFDDSADSPLWQDINKKIEALDINQVEKDILLDKARTALLEYLKPAYQDVINMSERHSELSDDSDGVWKLPNGEKFYNARLKHYTTTNLTAEEIHQIGLEEVERIKSEMQVIMDDLGFEGSFRAFFDKLRTGSEFLFENNDQGREAYINQATEVIDEIKGKMDDLFITKPKADMIVKRVEPYREASAFGAFYNRPAQDGSRPGTYYINLKDMNDLPIYQLEALAYHEGIPGHHMQLAIAQELQGLPRFRTTGGQTAYIEGWALYAERIPKELGLYTDPYQDFGRLSMEIFRAARLVVDTGIHSKQWTRQEAVDYMLDNTANAEGDIRDEVDRYIVWPGQATAYKIGMLKIDELRDMAEDKLGEDFDIREFHDVILANGPVPLSILEELVTEWINETINK